MPPILLNQEQLVKMAALLAQQTEAQDTGFSFENCRRYGFKV